MVFSDLVGYTRIASQDEREALTLAFLFHSTARRAAEGRNGRLVKTIGDAVLLEFEEPHAALHATSELISMYGSACAALGLPGTAIRSGVHSGKVIRGRDGDLFGDVVNVASRLEGIAGPGEIVASSAAVEMVQRAELPGLRLEAIGEQSLKNVAAPILCYRVTAQPTAAALATSPLPAVTVPRVIAEPDPPHVP